MPDRPALAALIRHAARIIAQPFEGDPAAAPEPGSAPAVRQPGDRDDR